MSVESKLSDLQLAVFDRIRLAGWAGCTVDEIEVATGRTHQSVSARVNELVAKKLIEGSGTTRKTRAGRGARVYILYGLKAANERQET